MKQGLKDVAHIYSQFTNNVFGLLLKTQNIFQMPIFIVMHADNSLSVYMNDHIEAATPFDFIYIFLHNSHFSRIAFNLIYLEEKKIKAFMDILKLLEFEKSCHRLKSLAKHCNKIEQMPIFILQKRLDTFL